MPTETTPRPPVRHEQGPAPEAGPGPEAEDRASILIVDDRTSNLEALESILAPLGQRVVRAGGGEAALRLCLREDFAVVLLDVRMPGMDGLETAEFLGRRERSRHTPILFLTAAEPEPAAVRRGYSLGAVDYISSPFDADILRSKVQVFVDLYRNRERERRLKRDLERKARELERSNADLAQFANVAAHDLREPLRTMRSYAELLAECLEDPRRAETDPKPAKYARHVVESADRMQRLIDDLLDYARFDRRESSPDWQDMSVLLDEAMATLERSIAESGARVTRGRLPSVLGDRTHLVRLLENLLSNAIKFRRPETPLVHVAAERRGPDWVFRVEDNGIGIAVKDRHRLFGLFERLHRRQKYPGTGLGLAICRKIVERHGGRIWVESQIRVGSTFFFTLPAAADAPREATAPPAGPHA